MYKKRIRTKSEGKTNWKATLKIYSLDTKIKEERERNKKVVGNKLNVRTTHAPARNTGAVETIRTSLWKPPFGHQITLHEPPEWRGVKVYVNHLFLIIFIFIKLQKLTIFNLIITKKKNRRKWWTLVKVFLF